MQLVGKGYSVVSHNIRVEFNKFICLKDASFLSGFNLENMLAI